MHNICFPQGIMVTFSAIVDMLHATYVKFLRDYVYQKSFKSLDFGLSYS